MEQYVLGFLFSIDESRVALIAKQKPQWQKGKFNGIGGKMEDFDDSFQSGMTREFKEETGVEVSNWTYCIVHDFSNCYLHIFRAFSDSIDDIKKQPNEIEKPKVFDVSDLPDNMIPNLKWIIPLLLDDHVRFPYSINIKGR